MKRCQSPILVVPACEPGRGGGHLFRSAALVKAIRAGGGTAWLYSKASETGATYPAGFPPELWYAGDPASKKNWSLIVLDRFRTAREEAARWSALAPVLLFDEGQSRNHCDFLIDLLPWPGKDKPNLCAPSLLPLPKKRRPAFPGSVEKVLVSFGAEDPGGLTLKSMKMPHTKAQRHGVFFTVVLGPLRQNNDRDRALLEEQGVTVFDTSLPGNTFNFKESLADYDLLITHFGLSAFEALYARVPVLIVNPSVYHEKLTRYAGLPSAKTLKKISYILEQSEQAALRWGLEGDTTQTAADLLLSAAPRVYRNCPLCGAPAGRIVGRFPGRTYRLCSCGTLSMSRLDSPPVEYNRDYFFDEYRKQYGKTYLEDFPQLQKVSEKRLANINTIKNFAPLRLRPLKPFLKNRTFAGPTPCSTSSESRPQRFGRVYGVGVNSSPVKLLDIGCAYGPFLASARDAGFEPMGLDPASDAVAYVREKLGITAVQGLFPDAAGELARHGGEAGQFDVITLWYVIEHFEEPGAALIAINSLLKMGGILAFSTPSAAGISRRKSLRSFLERSPADHWTIWNPLRCAAALKRYGFALKKTVITGHHPERFPGMSGFLQSFSPALKLAGLLSRIFGLGDTFEAYAVKIAEAPHG